jgi:hypothetical protein
MESTMTKETYSLEESALYLNASLTITEDLFKSGEIVAAKIGRSWSARRVHLEAYHDMEAHRQTLERREMAAKGIKATVSTAFGKKRANKPNLDNCEMVSIN